MFGSSSEEVQDNSTPEYRKCWALGEAFYYVNTYFKKESLKKDNLKSIYYTKTESEAFYYAKTKLEAIYSISKNLGLTDENIYIIIGDLRNKLTIDKSGQTSIDETTNKSLMDLESYLKAGLTGIEPQFEYIFSTARDCLLLYWEGEKTKDFLDNLIKFKNYTSPDKVELIVNVVNYWDKQKFQNPDKPENPDKLDQPDPKFPREVKNRIAGLILGTTEISDILTKWDRFWWVLICFIIVGLGIILGAILLITILFNIYQGFIAEAPLVNETLNATAANVNNTAANTTATTSEDDLTGILTTISTLAASAIPALGSAIIVWQKFANFVERWLAQQTLTLGKRNLKIKDRIYNEFRVLIN
ncbi:MAG TPA: hypothetical protein PLC38_02830 [Methanobacterium sp.]|nr:MAG: hypothetical protein FGO69_05210 [Methanobacterium sp.]HOI71202.1 hypothetical protein [Methanobacterium sp.]